MIASIIAALGIANVLGGSLHRLGFPLPSGVRIGHVDGLRGYLAMFVMVHHFIITLGCRTGRPWGAPDLNFYNQFGKSSVALFFMATGLLFYAQISKGFLSINWMKFYNGRLFRILPMLLVSTLLCALIVGLEYGAVPDGHFPVEIIQWMYGNQVPLLHVPNSNLVNASVFWSIRLEWTFYFAVFPAFSILKPFFPGRGILFLLSSLVLVFIMGVARHTLPLFILGMMAGEFVAMPRLRALLASRWNSVPVLVALIGEMAWFYVPYDDIGAMLLLAFVFSSIACGNNIFGLLSARGACVLGEISFSIYVLHGIVLYVVSHYFPIERLPALALWGMVVVVVLLSAGAFRAVERPCIGLGRDFYSVMGRWRVRLFGGGAAAQAN